MAVEISFNPKIEINAVDLSDQCKSAQFQTDFEEHDVTAFGDRSHGAKLGLENWQLAVEFFQDFAAGKAHATLDPLRRSTGFTVKYKKDKSAANSVSNPEYSGTCIMQNYKPVSGSVQNVLMTPVTFLSAGNLSIATA